MNATLMSLLPYAIKYAPVLLAFVAGVLVQAKHPLIATVIKADVAAAEAAAATALTTVKSL